VQANDALTIAVASNFLSTAEELAEAFTDETGTPVALSGGSTGKLYAQIVHGAPYDIFLAADAERPRELEKNGLAEAGSYVAYAKGQLVLISTDRALLGRNCSKVLMNGSYRKIAIANPATAPYGAAAKSYLQTAGIWDDARSRLVMGENILQTYLFVATGNATLGFVAAAQLVAVDTSIEITCRSNIDVSQEMTVNQGGVVLQRSENKGLARKFMAYLQSAAAMNLITAHGYEIPAR
jgi:molybdate transport system substrate-binding protein